MNSVYSYKDGYREGVLFVFYKNGMVLLEDRGLGFDREAFFPNGSVETKDKESKQYIKTALFREIKEEFADRIKVKRMIDLGQLKVDEINVVFYIFCIIEWEGDFPEYIIEPGELDSQIEMFTLENARKVVKYKSAFEILERIDNIVNDIQ